MFTSTSPNIVIPKDTLATDVPIPNINIKAIEIAHTIAPRISIAADNSCKNSNSFISFSRKEMGYLLLTGKICT